MKRGELWTASSGAHYAQKPRPVLILQDDIFEATDSVTVCLVTTKTAESPLFRLALKPSNTNGLVAASSIMIDKTTTVQRSKLGTRIGQLTTSEMVEVGRAVALFFGLGTPARH